MVLDSLHNMFVPSVVKDVRSHAHGPQARKGALFVPHFGVRQDSFLRALTLCTQAKGFA